VLVERMDPIGTIQGIILEIEWQISGKKDPTKKTMEKTAHCWSQGDTQLQHTSLTFKLLFYKLGHKGKTRWASEGGGMT
jgi:hypothetical protein